MFDFVCRIAFFYLRFESSAIHQDHIGCTSNRLSGLFDKFEIRAFMGFVTQWVWKNLDRNLKMWVSVLTYLDCGATHHVEFLRHCVLN